MTTGGVETEQVRRAARGSEGEVYESDGPGWDEDRVERVRRRKRGTTAGTLRQ